MDNIMKQITDRLQNGETPQDLIKEGFKRTTVYSINKKMKGKAEEKNDVQSKEQSMEQLIFLAFIVQEAIGNILSEVDRNHDCSKELKKWQSIIRIASNNFEKSVGKKPPIDFLNPTLKQPE